MATGTVLNYEGCNYFRQRLVLATLSGKSVKMKKIRWKDDDPGLRDYESSCLRLIETITNGSTIVINQTATVVFYQPGMLMGGEFTLDCNPQRGLGYYLEVLLALAPFCKTPIEATLRGVTNAPNDHSVDTVKYSMLPVLKRFLGTDEGLCLSLYKRGSQPLGGGEIKFTCPVKPKLRTLQLTEHGKIKMIRGTAWACRVSPAICNRLVKAAKGPLLKILQNVHIYTDHRKGEKSGKSPGFGLTLLAETSDHMLYTAELCSTPRSTGESKPTAVTVPEDLALDTVRLLLDEVYRGGCVDSNSQWLACLMMTLGEKNVSKLKIGPLTPYTIQYLRHIKDFFNVMFKLDTELQPVHEDSEEERQNVVMTCVGAGYRNLSKVII